MRGLYEKITFHYAGKGTFKGNSFSRKYNLAIDYHIEIMEESSFYKVVKEHELQRSLF